MSNIDKQALKPVGKFAFESVGARWHHVKHGEAQITLPKLPLMRLYAEDDVQALLDKLEVADKRIAELEASHNNLRGAMAGIHNTIAGGGVYTPLAAILNASKRAYEESAAAAGKGE